jgi:hypothetical protein
MPTRGAEEKPGEITAHTHRPLSLCVKSHRHRRASSPVFLFRRRYLLASSERVAQKCLWFFFTQVTTFSCCLRRAARYECAHDVYEPANSPLLIPPPVPLSLSCRFVSRAVSPGGLDMKRARRESFGPWGDPKKKYLYYCPQMKELAESVSKQAGAGERLPRS